MKHTTLARFLALGIVSTLSFPTVGEAIASSLPLSKTQSRQNVLAQATVPNERSYIWPAQGTITRGYLPGDYHPGIDITNAEGTPIVAAGTGVVTYAGWNDFGYGNYIKIRHADGNYTIYGHNQRILVQQGQEVRQGQTIALMGSTGFSDRPHLHFEIRPGDENWVDPMNLLPSLVAGKIPQNAVATAVDRSSLPTLTPSTNALPDASCAGTALIEGETTNHRIVLCQEGSQVFYVGQSKQNSSMAIRRPASALGNNRYRAENGTYSYYVDGNSRQIEVFRHSQRIRAERFLN